MLRIVLILLGLFLLFGGIHDAYNGWQQSEPARMTVAEYTASDQADSWVVLTDAKVNLLKAVTVRKGKEGKVNRLYVPIESDEFFQKEKISLLLDTTDKELLAVAEEMVALSAGDQIRYLAENRNKLLRDVELSGTMMSHRALSSDRAEELGKLIGNLKDGFYIMNHGATVDFTRGVFISIVALLLLVFAARRKKKAGVAPQEAQAT